MNKTQEALRMAIEALEASTSEIIQHDDYFKLVDEAHKTCKEALVECEQAEPFGIWHIADDPDECDFFLYKDSGDVWEQGDIYLYTAPPDQTAEIKRLKEEIEWLKANPRTDIVEAYETKINSLEVYINELRQATENYILEGETSLAELEKAIASTPAQSLQAHDDEVIERCAKIAENYNLSAGNIIRALKGKQNE